MRSNKVRLLSAALITLVIVFGAFAQSASDRAPVTTLSTSTEVVIIPAVVRDSSGKPATGLTRDSFFVLENDKPQKIAFFEEVRPSTALKVAKPPSGEFSNIVTADIAPQPLTIIVLDMVNTRFGDQAYARQQLLKYLSNTLTAGQPTALLALQRKGLIMLNDFTADPQQLIAALKKVVGENPTNVRPESLTEIGTSTTTLEHSLPQGLTGQGARLVVNDAERILLFRNGGEGELAALQERAALSATLGAFQQISNTFAGIPGRKSLVWATAGFPFAVDNKGNLNMPSLFNVGDAIANQMGGAGYNETGGMPALPDSAQTMRGNDLQSLSPLFERTMQMLNNANISVYPIDARGLVVSADAADRPNISDQARSEMDSRRINSQVSMNSIASLTGGRAFYNRNDLDAAYRQAAQDNQSYYYIGYYRDTKNDKPGYRKLDVKVNRPGLTVSARQGYYVAKKMDAKELKQADILAALGSPLEFTGIPMQIRWNGLPEAGKGNKKVVKFDVFLPPDKMAPPDELMNIDFVAMVTNAKGDRVDQLSQTVGADLKPEVVAQIRKEGLNYNNQLEVPPGDYTAKFVVRDNRNGRIGSVILPLKVQ